MTAILDLLLPRSIRAGVLAVLLAFLVGAVLIALIGRNPVAAYTALFTASLGSVNGLAETAIRMVPLALAGIGIALSFRAGIFNVGAEGQIYMGGVAAAAVGLHLGGASTLVTLTVMGCAAMLAGAAWSGIAAGLRLRFGADELITTIMLNYIAIQLVAYLLHGPLQDPASPLARTARLGIDARLPVMLDGTRLHAGVLLAVLVAVIAQVWLWATVSGFRFRAVGLNPRAAVNVGYNTRAMLWGAFLVCGALSGLAGMVEVSGIHRRMIETLSPGFGYTAIIVALLGRTNPLGVLCAAALFAALQIGSTTMESTAGVPSALTSLIQALVVLFLVGQNALSGLSKPKERAQ